MTPPQKNTIKNRYYYINRRIIMVTEKDNWPKTRPGPRPTFSPWKKRSRWKKKPEQPSLQVDQRKSLGLPGIPTLKESKKVAVKIAEKAGPRKCYNYFEFERLHLRRSRF